MIEINNLRKEFDGFYALDGVNMRVEKGSIYGLVGPNGAGKSTLIRHLTGVYRQNDGEILIDGQPVYDNNEVKGKIAYIPDDLFYFVSASVEDMMKFYRGIYKTFDMVRYNRLKEIFTTIDTKKNIRHMSKGMQKQAAFWLAICCNPEILILDEPVDGLDPVMRRQVWSLLMQDVAEKGSTVLISSHNLRELEDVCDHVGIMNKGKVIIERSLSELQGNITKLQIAFADGKLPEFTADLNVLNRSQVGKVHTLIVRENPEQLEAKMAKYSPVIMDCLPLTLEEIFVYELGGEEYAVKEIIL